MQASKSLASVVISGFATLDYVLHSATPLISGATVAAEIDASAWPRLGGAPLYAAARFAANGHGAAPLVAVGDDANGGIYRSACERRNVSTAGIEVAAAGRTPSCILIYHGDGSYSCALDAGSVARAELSRTQIALLRSAGLVCVAAGSAAVTTDILATIADTQSLAWLVKDDPVCFPADLRARLAARANYIFCNAAERPLFELHRTRPAILFETYGVAGVSVHLAGHEHFVTAAALPVADATGAGDTFAGEVLSHLHFGRTSATLAAERGVAAVRRLLQARMKRPL